MAKTSTRKPIAKPPFQATHVVVCRTINGYWIASTEGGRVTNALPVAHETARLASRHLPRAVARPATATPKRRP